MIAAENFIICSVKKYDGHFSDYFILSSLHTSIACKEAGVSQSAQLTKMMEDFINNRKSGT